MSSTLELLVVIAIWVIQIIIAVKVWRQIKLLSNFLPKGKNSLSLNEYELPTSQVLKLSPEAVTGSIKYQAKSKPDDIDADEYGEYGYEASQTESTITVHLIKSGDTASSSLAKKVIETINSYLMRNKGAVSDFNLIKDIVERNCDAVDDEINQQLPAPIYLGLMGTVLGIILGLLSIDFDPNNFMLSVTDLISSVKWAMGCSFLGLLLTTLLSVWTYRGAKAKLEEQKNELYTFIQIELLPQLSQDANSTILAMQSHLEKFNEGFSENVKSFDGIMSRILEAFDSQVELTEQLKTWTLCRSQI